MGTAARAVTKSLRRISDYRTRTYALWARNACKRQVAYGRGSLTTFSRCSRSCAAGARCAAFSRLAEGLCAGAARGSLAGCNHVLCRRMALSRRSGARVHQRSLYIVPALLWAAADGIHLRYLRVGHAFGAPTTDWAIDAGASDAHFGGISKQPAVKAPLPAGLALRHLEHRPEQAANADQTARARSNHDQRLDQFRNQARRTHRQAVLEEHPFRSAAPRRRLNRASGSGAANSNREPQRR